MRTIRPTLPTTTGRVKLENKKIPSDLIKVPKGIQFEPDYEIKKPVLNSSKRQLLPKNN